MKSLCIACLTLPMLAAAFPAEAQNSFTNAEHEAIQSFLKERDGSANAATVVGLVDEQGNKVFSVGKLDNGTDEEVNGDTVFFIGSVSKTFTALLLLEMVERGEVKLDDPVAKYLPASVKVPRHGGRAITLVDLATHTAGLPINPDNMVGAEAREQYETYTVESMIDFLSGYTLQRDPGTVYEYSNVGMALLGHAMERRADATFESLIIERICRPLGMDSTCITLSPELKGRLAMGHDDDGKPSPPWKFQAYSPAGNIHSTANDLLKYAAAQVGRVSSKLTPLIEKSHVFRFEDTGGLPGQGSYSLMGRTAMDWVDRNALQPPGMELLGHAGGAGSYHAWVGFDKRQRRGVVVLSTANDLSVEAIGWTILQRLPLAEEQKNLFARELVGIGTALDFDPATQTLRITNVYAKSPAAQAGLYAGLLVQKIDDASTTGKSLAECVDLIRGPAGTKVRLVILDPERNATTTVELTREKFVTSNS